MCECANKWLRKMDPFCLGLPPHVEYFDDDEESVMYLALAPMGVQHEASVSELDSDRTETDGENEDFDIQETIKKACQVIGMIAVIRESNTGNDDHVAILDSVEVEIQKALQDVMEAALDGYDCQRRVPFSSFWHG